MSKICFGDPRSNGKYIFKTSCIGKGCQGEVYKVEQINSNARFCAKIISCPKKDRQSVQHINEEIKILQELSISGNVHVTIPNEIYLRPHEVIMIMPRAVYNLNTYASTMNKGRGSLDMEELLYVGHQIGKTLVYLHQKGLAHRDVKPSNILVFNTTNGKANIKLTDFGISIRCSDMNKKYLQSRAGTKPFQHQLMVLSEFIAGIMAPISYYDIDVAGFAMTMLALYCGVVGFEKVVCDTFGKHNPIAFYKEINDTVKGILDNSNKDIHVQENRWIYEIFHHIVNGLNANKFLLNNIVNQMQYQLNKSNPNGNGTSFNCNAFQNNRNNYKYNNVSNQYYLNQQIDTYLHSQLPDANNRLFWDNMSDLMDDTKVNEDEIQKSFTTDGNLNSGMFTHWWKNIKTVANDVIKNSLKPFKVSPPSGTTNMAGNILSYGKIGGTDNTVSQKRHSPY